MLADRTSSEPIIVLYDEDREKLIKDILDIKRDAYYDPKYVIAKHSKTTRQRPQEFAGGFEEWFCKVRELHLTEQRESKATLIEKTANRKKFVEHVMNRMMQVD